MRGWRGTLFTSVCSACNWSQRSACLAVTHPQYKRTGHTAITEQWNRSVLSASGPSLGEYSHTAGTRRRVGSTWSTTNAHITPLYSIAQRSAVWCSYLYIPYEYHNFAVKNLLLDVNVLKEDGKVHVHLGTSPNVRLD